MAYVTENYIQSGYIDTGTGGLTASLEVAPFTLNASVATVEANTITASLEMQPFTVNGQIGDIPRLATLAAKLTD